MKTELSELATKQAERKAKIGTATERYKAAKAQVVNVEKENSSQTPKIQKKGSSNFKIKLINFRQKFRI